jgi:cysteine desulfurase
MSARLATYLDANASAPLRPEVREALERTLASSELVPNPSSIHSFGRKAKKILNGAREKIARSFGDLSFGSGHDPITFTSSGTEASQLAIRSVLEPAFLRGEKPHWITTPVEHDATLRMIDWTKERGGSVSFLPVDSNGAPDVSRLRELVTPSTRLVSVIWVNNETGVVTDVLRLSAEASDAGLPLHLDGAQAWGKIELSLPKTGAAYVSFSGHKIGALSGTGVLWKSKPATPIASVIFGNQEQGARGGSENVFGILSLGAAADVLRPVAWDEEIRTSRDQMEEKVLKALQGVRVNGAGAARVANTLSLSFEGIERFGLVPALDLEGYALSSGSACSSGVSEPSHVLRAMGHTLGLAAASIRISLAEPMSEPDIDSFVAALSRCVYRMRNSS